MQMEVLASILDPTKVQISILFFRTPEILYTITMHLRLSHLLILTPIFARFFNIGSASILRSSSHPSSAHTITGTTPLRSDPPTTNALFPRVPEQQAAAPSLRCNCREVVKWSHCIFYQILNWPTEHNIITRLHDELIKCGAKNFGLLKYYIPERESGLGAFACFRLPHIYQDSCWLKAASRALGAKVEACELIHPGNGDPFPWWEDTLRTRRTGLGIRYSIPPPDFTFPPDN